eukprot:NODE_18107_length_910_cov_2.828863.p1 GENE.NODE_18107_length_910_cov_2.828863~~NODE_18107_length_910_cov_2.828863.p1  ORF type:complete len:228 (-),score=88.42 NODE_18107_length_910_cov_2.828863:225-854(-)
MQKYAFAELFVSMDGCRVLAMWLRSLPNGELPNAHIRSALLQVMLRLPITKDSLASCKEEPLGAIVAKLSQNPAETIQNRKAAGQLVQKWLKEVLIKRATHYDLDVFGPGQEDKEVQPTLPYKPAETMETLLQAEEESAKRQHPRMPMPSQKEYLIQPVSVDQPFRRLKMSVETNRGKVTELLTHMARPNKKSWRPYEVSIAGRNVNII